MRRLSSLVLALLVLLSLVVPVAAASFDDVPSDHVFAADIDWLAESGITRGCNPPENTNFCPDESVTRGQMAAFLVRALNLTQSGPDFDDTSGNVFEEDISKLAQADITRGCNPPENTNFCPDDPVSRGQMAAFLHRALENGTNPPPPPPDQPGTLYAHAFTEFEAVDLSDPLAGFQVVYETHDGDINVLDNTLINLIQDSVYDNWRVEIRDLDQRVAQDRFVWPDSDLTVIRNAEGSPNGKMIAAEWYDAPYGYLEVLRVSDRTVVMGAAENVAVDWAWTPGNDLVISFDLSDQEGPEWSAIALVPNKHITSEK
ncbi:MAG: hypothetical protein GEU79_11825, partial [Acidimicrobiia bacterium]|nr:hypothetical protein [Acidimicrobiia bacterium]